MVARFLAVLLGATTMALVLWLAHSIYLEATSPSCAERGGRVVQTGTWLQPIPVNNTIVLIPQPLYACEGAKQ